MNEHTSYELWDTEGRNLIAARETETAAVEFVRTVLADGGEAGVRRWVLTRTDIDSGDTEEIAYGDALVDLALAPASPRSYVARGLVASNPGGV